MSLKYFCFCKQQFKTCVFLRGRWKHGADVHRSFCLGKGKFGTFENRGMLRPCFIKEQSNQKDKETEKRMERKAGGGDFPFLYQIAAGTNVC